MEPSLAQKKIRCPYCGERIDIVLDLSSGGQSYVEDCQVCCQPIQVGFDVEDGALRDVRVDRAG